LLFFRWVGLGVVGIRFRALTSFPSSGTDDPCLHQTRIEVLSPWRWPLQRLTSLCALETYRYPHTVLFNRAAARLPCASSLQARGRGSTRHPCATIAACKEPERVSNQPQRAQGSWPMCSWAFTDAARHVLSSTLLRLPPCTSSSASGSPAPLTTSEETCAYQRPFGVLTCSRQHAPVSGPGESRLCLGRVFSPVWSGTFGRRDCPAERAPPLPRRPT
jgi:hypothetical protein